MKIQNNNIEDDLESENTGADAGIESVEDTVLKAYELASKEQDSQVSYEVQGEKEPPPAVKESKQEPKTADVKTDVKVPKNNLKPEVKDKTPQDIEELEAPSEWNAKAKEWFNSLPKEFTTVKKEFARIHNQQRDYFRQQSEILSQERKRANDSYEEVVDIVSAIKPHISSWGTKGITPAQAISQLAAFQTFCMKDKVGAVLSLAESLKVNLSDVAAGKAQPGIQQNNISQHPEYISLANEVREMRNYMQNMQSSQTQSEEQSIVQEYIGLRNEMIDGRYQYPMLHDQNFVNTQFEPLLADIKRNQPNLSWRDAMHRAYVASGGTLSNLSSNGSPKRLERENSNVASAKLALNSSAGSQTSFSNGFKMPEKIETDPEKTVLQAMAMLSGR